MFKHHMIVSIFKYNYAIVIFIKQHISKVSSRFEFLLFELAPEPELILVQLDLYAQLYGESDGVKINGGGGHRAKINT